MKIRNEWLQNEIIISFKNRKSPEELLYGSNSNYNYYHGPYNFKDKGYSIVWKIIIDKGEPIMGSLYGEFDINQTIVTEYGEVLKVKEFKILNLKLADIQPNCYYVGWQGVALRKLPKKFNLPKLSRLDSTLLTTFVKPRELVLFTEFVLVGKSYFPLFDLYYIGWQGICLRSLPKNRFSLPKLSKLNSTPLMIEPEKGLTIIEEEDYSPGEVLERFRLYKYNKYEDFNKIFEDLLDIKTTLEKINVFRGVVNSTDVRNSSNYPILSEVFNKLVKREHWIKLSNLQKVVILNWVRNVLMLAYYEICIKCLKTLNYHSRNFEKTLFNEMDLLKLLNLISCFEVLKVWSHNFLDNSIKQHLRKTNPVMISEICTGFDTEYQTVDLHKNDLLSAQISVTGSIKLLIPILKEFEWEGVNTLTSDTYLKTAPKFEDSSSVKSYIYEKIKIIRNITKEGHDRKMIGIANYFINNSDSLGIESYNKNKDGYIFKFNKRPIVNKFLIPEEGESLKLSLITLMNFIDESISLKEEKEYISKMLDYCYTNIVETELINASRTCLSWNGKTLISKPVQTIIVSNELNRIGKTIQKERIVQPKIFSSLVINYSDTYLLYAHYNAADLGMLEDWNLISKENVDVLKKSFTTLIKPLKINNYIINIRDTYLLSSAAASTLESIGKAHGLKKTKISLEDKQNMRSMFFRNPNLFREYAMNDSLITLIHALFINEFSFRLGSLSNPNALGSLSNLYVRNKWREDKYRGYQIDHNYPLGDVQTSATPRGITSLGPTGDLLNMFIGSFRGGRNECFSYGIDTSTRWYDYDLTSCYATIMSMNGNPEYVANDNEQLSRLFPDIASLAGNPNYSNGIYLNPYNVQKLNFKQGYSALRVQFCLPESIKYPPIPVNLDKNITIYPLSGETTITGLEYLSACNILKEHTNDKNYFIKVLDGFFIPFKTKIVDNKVVLDTKPFYNVINELQANRRKHPKKTAMERIYKDLGNMLYGKVVCGISNKRSYDARTNMMKAMSGNEISNPIIGAWITGFVRSILAELLNRVDGFGGKVSGVTTDGFVCDIPDLENKIIEYNLSNNIDNSFVQDYRNIRQQLSGSLDALEVKTNVKGLIQWTTRGQLSMNHTDPDLNNFQVPIAAMTGWQKYHFTQEENIDFVKNTINKGNLLMFLQKSLTGARQLYKDDKQVSMVSSLRKFKTVFDSKREIIFDNEGMLFSKPFKHLSDALLTRALMNQFKTSVYSEQYTTKLIYPPTNAKEELLRYFIRLILEFFDFNITQTQSIKIYNWLAIIFKFNPRRFNHLVNNIIINERYICSNKLTPIETTFNLPNSIIKVLLETDFLHELKTEKFFNLLRIRFSNFNLNCLNLNLVPFENLLPLLPITNNENENQKFIRNLLPYDIDEEFMKHIIHNLRTYGRESMNMMMRHAKANFNLLYVPYISYTNFTDELSYYEPAVIFTLPIIQIPPVPVPSYSPDFSELISLLELHIEQIRTKRFF